MNKTNHPTWFSVTIYIILVWNLIGLLQYIAHVSITPETLASMSAAERSLIMHMPKWVTAAFAIAVSLGLLASILLLMKKAVALPFFVLSLVAVVVQNYYSFFMSNSIEVMGKIAIAVSATVFTIGVLEIWLCSHARKQGWIR